MNIELVKPLSNLFLALISHGMFQRYKFQSYVIEIVKIFILNFSIFLLEYFPTVQKFHKHSVDI